MSWFLARFFSLFKPTNPTFSSIDLTKIFGSPKLNHIATVRFFCEKYPEMNWLTGSVNATPEGIVEKDNEQSISKSLFKETHMEFDRTAVGCLCLKWVFFEEYEKFVECQDSGKLSRESFDRLVKMTKEILNTEELMKTALFFAIINDLGKVKSIEKDFGVDTIDHDEILLKALDQNPDRFVSFKKLSPASKKMILEALKAKFNMAQFIQGENLAGNVTGLKKLEKSVLRMYLLHALYDTAGAAGHIKNNGSLVMKEDTYRDYEAAITALVQVLDLSEMEIYQQYIEMRAISLELDAYDEIGKAAIRLCCMLRIHNPKDAKKVYDALNGFEQRDTLFRELNRNGITDSGILIYYSPALLLNCQSALSQDSSINEEALNLGLSTLFKIFQLVRQHVNNSTKKKGVYTVDVSEVANVAKNPKSLPDTTFVLQPIGEKSGKIHVS